MSGALRSRIVAAAVELTTEEGWAHVTMARLAERVGVSRQTVYNEVGNKTALAESMVLAELDRFLGLVGDAFDAHPGDLDAAMRAAVRGVLELARDNQLLRAVVSATHGADTELLPLLTTHSSALLGAAKTVVRDRVDAYGVALTGDELDSAIDVVVRVVLSHVMQPTDEPARTADRIAWVAGRVIGPH